MNNILFQNSELPVKVVDITYSVYQAFLGNYFLGQTEPLIFGGDYHAWGGLINPIDSGVNLFWNVFTVSNYSAKPFTTEFWLKSPLPAGARISSNVASANQAIVPIPQPKVELQYQDRMRASITDGIYSFVRIVEPNVTLTRHDFQGMIIMPPGSSIITLLKSPGQGTIESRIAFGWWEENESKSKGTAWRN